MDLQHIVSKLYHVCTVSVIVLEFNRMNLTEKKCVPCEGGVKPFNRTEAEKYLNGSPGWAIAGDVSKIEREFKFKDFKEAIAFVNRVADLAESEGHHPDINLFSYKNVKITLSTHAISGLSENDFILAAKINEFL
jgi:4a-hydroxytetrahydrobiopterin dehydratase